MRAKVQRVEESEDNMHKVTCLNWHPQDPDPAVRQVAALQRCRMVR